LSTSEQQALAGLKGYESMTLVSRRLEHELGVDGRRNGPSESGSRSGSMNRSTSIRQPTGPNTGSRRSNKRKVDLGSVGGVSGNGSGRKGKGHGLGTHSEMEEDGMSGNDADARGKGVARESRFEIVFREKCFPGLMYSCISVLTATSPPLGSNEAFLGQDMGRGPYLSSSPPPPPNPQHTSQFPSHRYTPSQSSTTRGGARHDSTVSWIPFDPTEGIKSPVGSFSVTGTSKMGGRGGHEAEDILRGSTLCAVYLVSGLPKVSFVLLRYIDPKRVLTSELADGSRLRSDRTSSRGPLLTRIRSRGSNPWKMRYLVGSGLKSWDGRSEDR
jgi:hypothetical protein